MEKKQTKKTIFFFEFLLSLVRWDKMLRQTFLRAPVRLLRVEQATQTWFPLNNIHSIAKINS
jgi:hypothetical protein